MAPIDRSALLGSRLGALAAAATHALTDAQRRVLLAHVAAAFGTLVVIVIDGTQSSRLGVELLILGGISALRVVGVRRDLAASTLVLDAAGTAVFLAGTGAPASVYFFVALAGAWWAAHVPRHSSGLLWAVAFTVVYGVLVVPGAIAGGLLVHALEDASVVIITALLSDWFVRVDRRALDLSDALAKAPAGAERLAIRDALNRTMGPMEIPIDVLVAAGRTGLTVIQAELLAYLALGLTNQEIAEATNVGEATVRYRLTRLYRALGVSGRKKAVARASELGLSFDDVTPANTAPRRGRGNG